MIKRARELSWVTALTLLMAGCTAESGSAGPTGLEVKFAALENGAAPCKIERIARVDQALYSLYMVRGEGRYRLEDGQTRRIPVQIQFRGMDGIVDDDAITLTDFETSCDQVAIEWTIEYCQNQDRDKVACPPFDVTGQEAFRAFSLAFE